MYHPLKRPHHRDNVRHPPFPRTGHSLQETAREILSRAVTVCKRGFVVQQVPAQRDAPLVLLEAIKLAARREVENLELREPGVAGDGGRDVAQLEGREVAGSGDA